MKSFKPWYDGYCFSEEKVGKESVFNSDMVLYHLKSLVFSGKPPKNMVDRNIATDYEKLQTIADIPFFLSWRFPNRSAWERSENGCFAEDELVGNHYCQVWPDALSAADAFLALRAFPRRPSRLEPFRR